MKGVRAETADAVVSSLIVMKAWKTVDQFNATLGRGSGLEATGGTSLAALDNALG